MMGWSDGYFVRDIQWIIDSINQLLFIEDKEHFNFLEQINKEYKELDFWHKRPLKIQEITFRLSMLNQIVKTFENIRPRLNEIQIENIKVMINSLIELVNQCEVVKIE